MKKIQTAMTLLIITAVSAMFSFSGATAEEKKSGQTEEFHGSSVRSHGHPVANLSDAPTPGTKQNQSAFVNIDDANSELEWQKWNKANETNDRKAGVAAARVFGSAASNPIVYHTGGAIGLYTGATQVIPVWVGAWSDAGRKAKWNSILSTLVTSLGGNGDINKAANVFNTNLMYFSTKNAAQTLLTWPTVTASATIPANLKPAVNGIVPVSDADVATYINTALTTGVISAPTTGRAIYVYIGGNNTRLSSGFGTAYCGWHTYGTIGVKNIPYIAIQDFNSNYLSACSAQTISPNGDAQLDAMASVLVHEIDEVITDADIRTWYDARGAENADKCAWTFGTTNLVGLAKTNYNVKTSSGVVYYLIQRNWLANNLVTDTVAGTACVVTNG
jgi:Phosphate-induced protein 1 conserved region